MSSKDVKLLRKEFFKKLSPTGDEFHPNDVNRVKTDDTYLDRFIRHNEGNMEKALAMLWDACEWRKTFDVNFIEEGTVNMSILKSGSLFPYGKDKDGNSMLVFKTKLHHKDANKVLDERRCLIYWLERMERQENGGRISLFFDMDGASLSNLDMDYTSYLIGLFKNYYPDFLNYIIILEMAWTLRAAFGVIKSWLPEKAVQKLKFVNKSNVLEYVHQDYCLESWGGTKNYVFHFEPEKKAEKVCSRKVHFAQSSVTDDQPAASETAYSEQHECANSFPSAVSRDQESKTPENGSNLEVYPENIMVFALDANDFASRIILKNLNKKTISFKIKTTSPEKFRVRPGTGLLLPNGRVTITVSLFSKYSLNKDKFLIMSTVVDKANITSEEVEQFWKDQDESQVHRHKLMCSFLQMPPGDERKLNAIKSDEQERQQILLQRVDGQVEQLKTDIRDLRKELKVIRNFVHGLILCTVLVMGLLFYNFYRSLGSQNYGQSCWVESRDG